MRILHTEASPGWGGQELRILREAEGMRSRGHEVILVIQKGGGLVKPARLSGFCVYEVDFQKMKALNVFYRLFQIFRKHKINIINTHSSLDAWIGGCLGKICACPVIRTRHLSTPIRKGINSRFLYNYLADYVVTTCEEAAVTVRKQAGLPKERCFSIPTGVDPSQIKYSLHSTAQFREEHGIMPQDFLVGTLCVLRGWKGISDLLRAAKLLKDIPYLKWIVVGSGVSEQHFKQECKSLDLEHKVIFTGHLSSPFTALAALDIFLLLSWANEGVSQASLQAAWLKKPLITTTVGGLPEVCIHSSTGIQVPTHSPEAVAEAVLYLIQHPEKCREMGKKAHDLVEQKFTLKHTLDQMEALY